MLPLIPPAGAFDMPDLIRAAMAAGGKVACHRPDAYWKDIGRLDHYEAATARLRGRSGPLPAVMTGFA